MLSLQYWLGGNSDNLENFLLNLTSQYVPALKGVDFGKARTFPKHPHSLPARARTVRLVDPAAWTGAPVSAADPG